jgi:polyhydroxyalkanoate synthesis repressor PhaR
MSNGTQAAEKHLEIRKYPNRRYYDATHSRHLTLEEIRSLIRQGYDLRVTDSKTSAEITAQVLAQIILELETPKLDLFPVPFLLRLIRANDQLMKDLIERYFKQALKAFVDYQNQFEEGLRQMQEMPMLYPPLAAWSQGMLAPFSKRPNTPETSQPTDAEAPAASSPTEDRELRRLIESLQQQVAALHQQVAKKTSRPRGKKG